MNHKKSGYKVSQKDSAYYRQHSSKGRAIEVWADIIKPVDEPELAEECEYKLAKIIATIPINPQKLQSAVDEVAPGYKIMAWWIPETEDQF